MLRTLTILLISLSFAGPAWCASPTYQGRTPAEWAADLRTPATRDRAALALAWLGPDARTALPDLLAADCLEEAAALGAVAVPALAKLARGDDPARAVRALAALANVGAPAAPALHDLLGIRSKLAIGPRQALLAALLDVAAAEPRPRSELLREALADPDELVRVRAAGLLLQLDPEAAADTVPVLLRASRHGVAGEAARFALHALRAAGEGRQAVPALVGLLKSPAGRQALHALRDLGGEARDAVPALLEQLKKPDHRLAACAALGAVGPTDEIVAALLGLLGRSDVSAALREEAATALAGFGRPARAGLQRLAAGDDLLARRHAVRALSRMGDEARPALAVLRAAAGSDDPELALAAAGALAGLGERALARPVQRSALAREAHVDPATRALVAAGEGDVLADELDGGASLLTVARLAGHLARQPPGRTSPAGLAPLVRPLTVALKRAPTAEVITALARLGPLARPATPALVAVSRQRGLPAERLAALGALGVVGGPEATAELKKAAADDDIESRVAAVAALAVADPAGTPFAMDDLLRVLRTAHPASRRAAEILGQLGPPPAARLELRACLARGDDRRRAAAVRALGPAARDSVAGVRVLARSPAQVVREAARQILADLGED